MSFSSGLAITAVKLLTTYGSAAVLTKKAFSTYNPSTGNAAATNTTYNGYAYSRPFTIEEVGGTVINGDTKIYIKVSVVPEVGDSIQIDNDTYRVMKVIREIAQGNDVLSMIQGRN